MTHPIIFYWKPSPFLLIKELDANEIGSWLSRTIEVTRVTVGSFIQVFLEGVEDVLYPAIYLNFEVFIQYEGIIQLGIEIEEIGGVYQFILIYIGIREAGRDFIGWGKVWYVHASGIDTRQREIEVLERCGRKGEVTVTIGSTWHVLGAGYR